MAAAEARAAWQRAANRCLLQEDRKRAPKLACCPSSSEQQHGTNNGNCKKIEERPVPNFMPLSWNPMNSNLPPDIRWWVQLQPNCGEQLYFLGRENGENESRDSTPMTKHEEPLLCGTIDTNPEKIEEFLEPPWMVSKVFLKHENKEYLNFNNFHSPQSNNPQKGNFDMDAPWKEGEKTQPWWQITDENELASLVAKRAMQHIENCDLPRPSQTVRVQGIESHSHESMGRYGKPSSPAGTTSYPYPGRREHNQCSSRTTSTDELDLTNDGAGQQHERNGTYSPSFQNPAERAQLLEALRHSQTRARVAEMAGKKAHSEKDDVIKLLFRQASHLFACKQWLKMLQLENICIKLKHKEYQIATMLPDLPWMTLKKNPTPDQEGEDWTRKKGRRHKKGGGFCDAILFAVGLGLAGAGLLLGWTLGWLLAKL